jgi:hypothetical protein
MSEALDKVLNNADVKDRVYKLARSWGATEELADMFADSKKDQFKFDGVNLTWNVNGKIAVDDPETKAYFTQGAFKTIFPSQDSTEQHNVDPALLASARAGNMTAKSRLFVQVGRDQTKLDKLLTATPDKSTDTGNEKPEAERNNPWLAGKWSITRQGQIYKLDPAMAARLAKTANSHIGAVRPAKVA